MSDKILRFRYNTLDYIEDNSDFTLNLLKKKKNTKQQQQQKPKNKNKTNKQACKQKAKTKIITIC